MRPCLLLCAAFVAVLSGFAAPSRAASLFPDVYYHSTTTGFYPVPGGLVTLEGLILTAPTGQILAPAAPGTSLWSTGTTFDAQTFMSFFGGPTLPSFNAGDISDAKITGTLDAPGVHTYDTEMLTLNLNGLPSSAMIRENPAVASTGGETVVDTPFHIDSFFDVFTELSLDGGANWFPATGPVHIQNPEPASLALLAFAAAPLISRHRRRR